MCTFCLYVSFIRKTPPVGCPTFGVHFIGALSQTFIFSAQ
jgi:hypothetical protein